MKNILIVLAVSLLAIHHVQGQSNIAKPAYCPIPVKRPMPLYPEILRRAAVKGIVELSALVDEKGSVEDVKVVRSAAPLLDTASMKAAKLWKFKPGQIADSKGVYVKSKFWFPIIFDWPFFGD